MESRGWRTALDLNRVEVPTFQDPGEVDFSKDHLQRVEVIDNPDQLALQVALLTMDVAELSTEVAELKRWKASHDNGDRHGRRGGGWRGFWPGGRWWPGAW